MTAAAPSGLLYLVSRGRDFSPLTLDFAVLQLPYALSAALRRALEAEVGHNTADTVSKCFSALRQFSKFLHDQRLGSTVPLPKDIVQRFADWLDATPRGVSAQVYLQNVVRLLSWCHRNVPGVIAAKASFRVRRIRAIGHGVGRDGLNEEQVKKVLACCYDEIEATEIQRRDIQRILSGETRDEHEAALSELLHELLKIGGGRLPSQDVVNRSRHSLARRVEAAGGHRVLAERLWISPRAVLPFYLAILVQTSANPVALLTMSRSPVIAHPLRSDLERITWMKARSKRQQYSDFPSGRQWGAPSIARRLATLNEDLLPWCAPGYRGRLFISHGPQSRLVGIPVSSTWQAHLQDFLTVHDLPMFHFREVRRTGAQLILGVTATHAETKKRLNHQSEETSRRYTNTQGLFDEDDQTIHSFQLRIVKSSLEFGQVKSPSGERPVDAPAVPESGMETLFGFRCRDPFAGLMEDSTPGELCKQFSKCGGCPGSLVPLDDVRVVARLLASAAALEDARIRSLREGWWPRYELVYEPMRVIISQELLPSVHAAVLERAQQLDMSSLVPFLE